MNVEQTLLEFCIDRLNPAVSLKEITGYILSRIHGIHRRVFQVQKH